MRATKKEYRYKSTAVCLKTTLPDISTVVNNIKYKSMDLLFFRGLINFKTIYTFLEQRFDEKENFALLEHLKILIKNLLQNSMVVAL
jgi:hypothetical protein